ncbi:MAG: HAD-IIA family hydrolase [Tepidisphaeraceae bacterium]
MSIDFSPYQAVLLDLDGTLSHEEHALPGAVELIRRLQSEKLNFALLSNSTTSPLRVMNRLDGMGVDVEPTRIYTAAAAACDYVMIKFPPRPRVFNLATEAVGDMLEGLVNWVQTPGEPCDVVIVGSPANTFATDERQRVALQLARKTAAVVGICADRVYPSPRGIEFGSGALTWMLAYAANVEPVFCGKPERIFFDELCARLQVDPRQCILIGDNLEADILGAKAMGMRTILTLSGVTRRRDLLALAPEARPDLVVEDLRALA